MVHSDHQKGTFIPDSTFFLLILISSSFVDTVFVSLSDKFRHTQTHYAVSMDLN